MSGNKLTPTAIKKALKLHQLWLNHEEGGVQIDWRGVNLGGAYLADANFAKANFAGANLADANFIWSDLAKANFAGANLADANFAGADLAGANLEGTDLRRAVLTNANLAGANLSRANFRKASLARLIFVGANLEEANLEEAYLEGANLGGANLAGANLEEAYLEEADLEGANLEGANLKGANVKGTILDPNVIRIKHDLKLHKLWLLKQKGGVRIDWKGANLQYVDLEASDLEKANLEGANLKEARLRGANLSKANLEKTNLREAWLVRANLEGTYLKEANLEGAWLVGANLAGANLEEANLEEANLEGANLEGAFLEGAFLEGANLEGAFLEGANVTDTILEVIVPEERVALGRKRRVIRKLEKAAKSEQTLQALQEAFPPIREMIKDKSLNISLNQNEVIPLATVQKLIDNFGMTWICTKGKYRSTLQRASPIANDVLQMNVRPELLTTDDGVKRALDIIRKLAYHSGHPVFGKPDFFTIGWVRYNIFAPAILIEEVQSDLGSLRRHINTDDFITQVRERDLRLDRETINTALDILNPFAKRFYHDALSLMFDIGDEADVPVEMMKYKQKHHIVVRQPGAKEPPEETYRRIPKDMKMVVISQSRLLPIFAKHGVHPEYFEEYTDLLAGPVWSTEPLSAMKPNRRARKVLLPDVFLWNNNRKERWL